MHAPPRFSRVATASLLLVLMLGRSPIALAIQANESVGAQLPIQNGTIELAGDAAPGAQVTFERNGTIIGTQQAGSDSSFDDTFTSQDLGSATYSIYYTDTSGRVSDRVDTLVTIIPGFTVTLSGYLLPPTMQLAATTIKRPQAEHVFGSTRQGATVTTIFSGTKYGDTFSSQGTADANGNWNNTPGQTLHLGAYSVSALAQGPGGEQSPQTTPQSFNVVLSADLNNDNRVNLTDFSILMFYYGRSNINVPADINDDGKANLTDLSIMLFYWTG